MNEEVIKKIEEHFGKLDTSYGKEYSFLGMMIRFLGVGKFEIDMTEMESITAFGEDYNSWKKVAAPVAKYLHSINPYSRKLDEEKK